MDLTTLFETQRQLDDRIEQQHPRQAGEGRLSKKILALQVELGELANEWRGFKFWSNDQEPRTEEICSLCEGSGEISAYFNDGVSDGYIDVQCPVCEGYKSDKNPLLEEYVDCLHFILSIGLGKGYLHPPFWHPIKEEDITSQFNSLFRKIGDYSKHKTDGNYSQIFGLFYNLGGMLGFTWDQVEAAYYDKNKINLERQANGY